jgi:tRNA-modifying protein YgfZ
MTPGKIALLPDRGAVSVRGPDAEKLLQGLLTNDLAPLAAGRSFQTLPAVHAGLLTPQGKILFEMLVMRPLARGREPSDAFILETGRQEAPALADRLAKYKLRADVVIENMSDTVMIAALWGAGDADLAAPLPIPFDASPTHYKDPRHPALGLRWNLPDFLLTSTGERLRERMLASALRSGKLEQVDAADYHAHRVGLGVPEAGKDYALGDAFPHEANFDLLHGISFTKGCYVGQEVVSRMQHRGLARKRVVIVEAETALQAGSEITAGTATIGAIGSVAGSRALATVRLDRASEAKAKGEALLAGGVRIEVRLPDYFDKVETAAGAS